MYYLIGLDDMGLVLPALAIGYSVDIDVDRRLSSLESHPAWFAVYEQQAGGLGRKHPSIMGVVLRLETNKHHATCGDPEFMIRGLKYMGKSKGVLTRDYPTLRPWVETWGEDYSLDALLAFEQHVGKCFRTPRLAGGYEAFTVYEVCDPLEYFQGWQVLTPYMASHVEPNDINPYLLVENGDVTFTEDLLYDSLVQHELKKVGSQIGITQEPRVYLLWTNSD